MSLVSYTGSRLRDNDRAGSLSRYFGDNDRGSSLSKYFGDNDRGSSLSKYFGDNDRSSQGLISKDKFNRRSRISDDFFNDDDDFKSSSTRGMLGGMDSIMGSMMSNPFGNDPFFRGGGFPAIMGGGGQMQIQAQAPRSNPYAMAMAPYGSLMSGMDTMAREGSYNSYSSSSVMSMNIGPDGRPQVYQASSSSRCAPGGVRETQRTESDSQSGTRKLAIGHHIEDRSHVIEKELNREGDVEERQEFVNLDEEEAPTFNSEFRRRIQPHPGLSSIEGPTRQRSSNPRATYQAALPAPSSYRRRTRPSLSITPGSSSRSVDRPRHRERGPGGHNNHQYQ